MEAQAPIIKENWTGFRYEKFVLADSVGSHSHQMFHIKIWSNLGETWNVWRNVIGDAITNLDQNGQSNWDSRRGELVYSILRRARARAPSHQAQESSSVLPALDWNSSAYHIWESSISDTRQILLSWGVYYSYSKLIHIVICILRARKEKGYLNANHVISRDFTKKSSSNYNTKSFRKFFQYAFSRIFLNWEITSLREFFSFEAK